MSNELLQKVIDTTDLGTSAVNASTDSSTLSGNGLLYPDQANRFLDYMWDATILAKAARTIRMRSNTTEIDRVAVGQRIMTVAHRITARLKFGSLDSKNFVVHTCSNPLCQNPDHIIIGDASKRNQVMTANGRAPTNRNRGPMTKPQAGRKYKYDPDELIWIRNHTSQEIADRFGLTKTRASNLRHGVRTGFRWLDNYKA